MSEKDILRSRARKAGLLLASGIIGWIVSIRFLGLSTDTLWATSLVWASMVSGHARGQKGIERPNYRVFLEELSLIFVLIGSGFAAVVSVVAYITTGTLDWSFLVVLPVALLLSGSFLASGWRLWENLSEFLDTLRKPAFWGFGVGGTITSFSMASAGSLLNSPLFSDLFPFLTILLFAVAVIIGAVIVSYSHSRQVDDEKNEKMDEREDLISRELLDRVRQLIPKLNLGYSVKDAVQEAVRSWVVEKEGPTYEESTTSTLVG